MTAPNTLEELAADLCEIDATKADAQLDDASAFPSWKNANEKRRAHFMEKARQEVDAGRFILGVGWSEAVIG